MPTTTKD